MNKNNVGGFSALVVLLILVVIGALGFVGYKVLDNKNNSDKQTQTKENSSSIQNTKEADVALENFGIQSLNNVLVSQEAVREFNSKGLKGFYIFGDKLSGGRTNPNFEFASLKEGTKIVSAIDGIVGFIKEQGESGDLEVFIQPKEGSMWTIGYDHLTNVKVKKGDSVKAGDILGEPGMQNNGALRFEIQVNKEENGDTTHICPSTLLAASIKDKLLADLSAMQAKWESTTGMELYDLAAQDPIGCIVKTLTPEQAEGS